MGRPAEALRLAQRRAWHWPKAGTFATLTFATLTVVSNSATPLSQLGIQYDSFGGVECHLLVMYNIPQLVGDAAGAADNGVDVTVGMAVDPVFYRAGGDVIAHFDRKGAIVRALLELGRQQLKRRDVMSRDDDVLRLAFSHALFQKRPAAAVLLVETLPVQKGAPPLPGVSGKERG